MAKFFYDHLVVLDEVTTTLKSFELEKHQHEEMVTLMTKTVHLEVVNVILKKLPKEKHENFLKMLQDAPHDLKILEFLKNEIKDIEEEIKSIGEKVKKELLTEIKRAMK